MSREADLEIGTGRKFYVALPVEDKQYYDLHDATGTGITSSAGTDTDTQSTEGEECDECENALAAAEAENDALEIENEALTDLANGVAGSCGSTTFVNANRSFLYSGTVCFSGVSGALSATWNGTWTSPTGNGGLSGNAALTGAFMDESYSNIGGTNLLFSFPFIGTNGSTESESFSESATSSNIIPVAAIGVKWRGGTPTRDIAYTYF